METIHRMFDETTATHPDHVAVRNTSTIASEAEEITYTLPQDGTYIARLTGFAYVGGPYAISVTE